jgi:unsaturated rhamnogalacturonyl hydrolase
MPLMLLAPVAIAAAAQPAMPRPADVLAATRRVADWQIAYRDRFDHIPAVRQNTRNPRGWEQATFWVALTELADRDPRYAETLLSLGQTEGWRLGNRPFHADDQLIFQAWDWAARGGAGNATRAPAKAYYDAVLANRPTSTLEFVAKEPGNGDPECTVRWCWCDALFMAPASLLRMTAATGDPRYARFAHEEFRATTDYLFDRGEHLYFRDSRFFGRRDGAGRKLFWSRGNGWVMGGLVRILQQLDKRDPERPYYVALFREMAARLVRLQKADGYWAPSLLDSGPNTPPESSGTGFFVYAFAWGVESGLLDARTYRPAAIKGWAALQRAVQSDGMLGWVQQVSDRPDAVAKTDTQYYGTGAFLLAGTAMYDLARHGRGR